MPAFGYAPTQVLRLIWKSRQHSTLTSKACSARWSEEAGAGHIQGLVAGRTLIRTDERAEVDRPIISTRPKQMLVRTIPVASDAPLQPSPMRSESVASAR